MLYLDLGELPGLFDGYRGLGPWRALVEFRRADYLGDPRRPLAEEVLDLVQRRTGERPEDRSGCSPCRVAWATASTR